MTSRDVVRQTVRFADPSRLPRNFPEPYGTDFAWTGVDPSPDARPPRGVDEWGAVWENIGEGKLGQVKQFPLTDWADFANMAIPDISDPKRWQALAGARESTGDKFLLGGGISIYERVHFLRGLENCWIDIYENRDSLCKLLDVLVDMNLALIDGYAKADVDALMFCDDWGLQDRLMISPNAWREVWKPRYARIYKAAHNAGLLTFLHSCGYIVDILDDLIEAGLDVIHMDQQENMGLELLGQRFAGRITFMAPVDIQQTFVSGSLEDIREYCWRMVDTLATTKGGLIPCWYTDPTGAGHRQEAIEAMCEEFLKISRVRYEGQEAK